MYKSKLQELCQKRGLTLPVYTSEKEGPDHCPRFTATVTVNGALFQMPQRECRSSKEAQNSAAKVAFEFLGRVASGSGPAPVASPLRALCTTVAIGPTKKDPQQINGGKMQSIDKVDVNSAALCTTVAIGPTKKDPQQINGGKMQSIDKVDVNSAELHLYKNRLIQYVQKNHFSCPSYTSEFDGPPHCRRFRASVTIDGRTYQCSEHYPTMKDAEHAAAKAALESMSNAETVESGAFFKSLLQELAQKEGYQLPSYSTNRSGPSHNPTFASAVQVGDVIYQGEECKTKKQSEMSAAKFAYEKLINLKVAPEELGKCIASSQDASMKIADENCLNVGAKMSPKANLKRTSGEVEGCSSIVATGTDGNGSAPVLECGFIGYTLQNNSTKPAEKIELQKGIAEGIEGNAKRYKSSHEYMNLPLPPLSNDSCSEPDEMMKRVEAKLAEASGGLDSKILISRFGSDIEVPEGVSVVHDAEGWMAVKMNPKQDEQV